MFTPIMLRRYLAEFLGTFAYVFFCCGAKIVVGNRGDTTDLLFIYLIFGLTLFAIFLMLVFMSSATDRRISRAATGLAVGSTITLCGLFAALLTGGSMNPARSLAPALLAGGPALGIVWVYWIGPLLGAILGALAYELMRGGKEYAMSIPEGIFDRIGRARGSTSMVPQSSQGPQTEEQ